MQGRVIIFVLVSLRLLLSAATSPCANRTDNSLNTPPTPSAMHRVLQPRLDSILPHPLRAILLFPKPEWTFFEMLSQSSNASIFRRLPAEIINRIIRDQNRIHIQLLVSVLRDQLDVIFLYPQSDVCTVIESNCIYILYRNLHGNDMKSLKQNVHALISQQGDVYSVNPSSDSWLLHAVIQLWPCFVSVLRMRKL